MCAKRERESLKTIRIRHLSTPPPPFQKILEQTQHDGTGRGDWRRGKGSKLSGVAVRGEVFNPSMDHALVPTRTIIFLSRK